MSRVGKKAITYIVAAICIAFAISVTTPFSMAQSADTTAPVTSSSISGTPGTNGWYKSGSAVTVSLTATDDNSGVASTYYRIDGGAFVAYTGTSIPIADGRHTMVFYSKDNAGNQESAKLININVDTVAPTLNLTIKGNQVSGTYNGTATANLTAADIGGTSASGNVSIAYSLDGTTWVSYTGNFTLPDGSYTLRYGSVDWAGNTNNSTQAVTVFNPVINFDPAPNQWITDRTSISIAIIQPSDVDHVDISINVPGNWINAKTAYGNVLDFHNEGNATLYYRAVSTSGVTSSISKVWYGLDYGAPTVDASLNGGYDKGKGWYTGDVTVNINGHDAGGIGHIQYSWNNNSWTDTGGSVKVGYGSSKTIFYRVIDMGGRMAYGHSWIYFAPGSMNQGGMSNQVNVNGTLSGGDSSGTASASPTPSEGPMPTPTQQPVPTPTIVPSPEPSNTPAPAAGSPLAIAVLVGVLVLLGIVAAAAYLFVFKPK